MHNDSYIAQLDGVTKRYGQLVALDGIDLGLRRGELLALLGPNGAGKSTAIGLLLGLHRADSGSVSLFGRDPQDIEARRRIGVMLQSAALPPTLKVGELLKLTASYYPSPRDTGEAAAMAGVDDLLGRRYAALSGGQQRRVQFAMALCGRPELLFLDEPTVGMDIDARQKLWTAIRQLVADGCSVVLTTHYLEEAEALADRVCVIAHGKVISEGSVDALRARVAYRRIRCTTSLDTGVVAAWPGVAECHIEQGRMFVSTAQPENVVRRLLAADAALTDLEVLRAGLAEAFTELTRDNDDVPVVEKEAA
ncbi:ABC-2 type transport system ATP-binding protein [Luteibacter rhizovicinus]|uniref:ABC-2 type transport system ATP-binding protein n=1 Tax=Luteibacter rhizovicinus TaxID=242606 RepID=A0A4R3YR39_9GAMM|nr:ABC transporter ATP-binding protein [Luteibacter rhizovicinus]TCV94881.1 ABC-2 type transport system ATP-binding protein [Luteibacter rhizovicinus]